MRSTIKQMMTVLFVFSLFISPLSTHIQGDGLGLSDLSSEEIFKTGGVFETAHSIARSHNQSDYDDGYSISLTRSYIFGETESHADVSELSSFFSDSELDGANIECSASSHDSSQSFSYYKGDISLHISKSDIDRSTHYSTSSPEISTTNNTLDLVFNMDWRWEALETDGKIKGSLNTRQILISATYDEDVNPTADYLQVQPSTQSMRMDFTLTTPSLDGFFTGTYDSGFIDNENRTAFSVSSELHDQSGLLIGRVHFSHDANHGIPTLKFDAYIDGEFVPVSQL